MRIPLDQLSPDALDGILTEFVTRDGTELGEMQTKKAQTHRALQQGELILCFDPESGTCNLLSPEAARLAETSSDNTDCDDPDA